MDHPLPTRGTSSTRPRTRRQGAALLGAVTLLVALVAGCSTVRAFTDLDTALRDAGFTDTRVNVAAGDPVALTVSADAPPGDSAEEAQTKAAEVIWTTFPRRFEEARISIDGDSRTVTRDQLQEQFGDRPAGLDDQGDLADDVNRVGVTFLVGVLLTGLVIVLVGGVTALLIVRRRRRSAPRRATGPREPWAPPPTQPGGAPAGAVPPAGGWGDPQPGEAPPQGPSAPTTAPSPGGPPAEVPPTGSSPGPSAAIPVHPRSDRETRADARRLGRPARGPRPPATQVPRGWG